MTLDPSRRSARVTKEIADHLAHLARRLEQRTGACSRCSRRTSGCSRRCFTQLLKELIAARRPDKFRPQVEQLWQAMNGGGFAHAIEEFVPAFNGGLFADPTALDLEIEDIGVLLAAARSSWRDVEPAIFGTLLERALDPRERHKLGAHFTPRAYVERLVTPTVMEPLREDWAAVQASALLLAAQDKRAEALAEVRRFHEKLCATRVLDPACGTGNFLYVAMELMKRLEGEVIELARELGQDQYFLELDRHTVDPHQYLGIEINPRAAAIAELVLWIGYLQWHFRTRGQVLPAQPVLRNFKNIECRDAILTWDRVEIVRGPHGKPVTRWDGRTMKPHPLTGREVPDETAQEPLYRYVNPRPASWPESEFVVGNPPFVGNKRMKTALGEGYVQAVRSAYPSVPASADYVLYWWESAARLTRQASIRRFGLITTNSINQTFNRSVLFANMNREDGLSIIFAVADHPWTGEAEGAQVRVAMTVARKGKYTGTLGTIKEEQADADESSLLLVTSDGHISSKLDLFGYADPVPLKSNVGLSCPGIQLSGQGFVLNDVPQILFQRPDSRSIIKPFLTGRDLTQQRYSLCH
jgi:hypothetical protein